MEQQNELMHYGVLGMRWGVRRYQNSNGSYTQAGLQRYRKAESQYKEAHKKRVKAANDHNIATYRGKIDTTASRKEQRRQHRALRKESYNNYRITRKDEQDAKLALDRSYHQLKNDAKADKGAEHYRDGKTITGNYKKTAMGAASVVAAAKGTAFLARTLSGGEGDVFVVNHPKAALGIGAAYIAITLGGGSIVAGKAIKRHKENEQLRAYYGHESQKTLDRKVFGDKK